MGGDLTRHGYGHEQGIDPMVPSPGRPVRLRPPPTVSRVSQASPSRSVHAIGSRRGERRMRVPQHEVDLDRAPSSLPVRRQRVAEWVPVCAKSVSLHPHGSLRRVLGDVE